MKGKKIASLILAGGIFCSIMMPSNIAFGDTFNVISIGENLNKEQKEEMLKYFNAPQNSYQEIKITNKDERKQLGGILPDSQIGTKTISCAYVEPTEKGGINVKTTNLTYITGSMIANALTTAGIYNANVIAAAPFSVSGTGALTGVILGYQKATGEEIDDEKKELANKELATTVDIAKNPEVGQDKATAVISEIKSEVIQNGNNNQAQIGNIIVNVTNNYGVKLTENQTKEIQGLMQRISEQDYNVSKMKKTLGEITENIKKSLQDQGELKGFFNNLKMHFSNFWDWVKSFFGNSEKEAGITNQTNNDTKIGETGVSTGTSDNIKDVVTNSKDLQEQLKDKETNETIETGGKEKEDTSAEGGKNKVANAEEIKSIANEAINVLLEDKELAEFVKDKNAISDKLESILNKKEIKEKIGDGKNIKCTIVDKGNKDSITIKLSEVLEEYKGDKLIEITK